MSKKSSISANDVIRLFGGKSKRKGKGAAVVAVFAVIFLLGHFFLSGSQDNGPLKSKKQSPLSEGTWQVVHVVDGDTLDVANAQNVKYRIRLIGANSPETVKPNHPIEPFGPEASAFTKAKITEANNRVRVAFDGDQIDKYDRNLAMIYLQLPQGEVWLNELLIREGLAKAELQYRFSKGAKVKLRQAEEAAKAERKNIWSIEKSE